MEHSHFGIHEVSMLNYLTISDLLEKLSNMNGSTAGQKTDDTDDTQNQTHARRRKNSKDRTEPEEKDYTPEQLEGVRR